MLTKKLTNLHGKRIREYTWGKFPIVKETRTPFSRTLQVCYVPILHYKRIYSSFTTQNPQFPNMTSFSKQITAHQANRVILWIDHNLGGGTETYSKRQFAILAKEATILRLQYWHDFDLFFLHTPNREIGYCLFNSLDELTDLPCTEIVVNNLVGYKNALDVLKTVNQLKKRHPEIKVSARGHDYFGICPSYTLLDNNGKFCGLKDLSACASCCEKQTFHPLLRSGFKDIVSWRNGWQEFFDNSLD